MDAYARFRYTVKADVPEWRNGRRGGLKNRCLTTCEFDSRLGHQFFGFARRPFGSPFSFPAKKRPIPKEVDPIIQMQELRENRPAGAQAAMAVDTSCARRRDSPLAPARLAALDTVGQHEKRRDAPHARDASLRKRCRKKTKRYSAFAAFCFFAVATIVFTPFTARTMARTNRSTARMACSTGASAMPPVAMAVTFW